MLRTIALPLEDFRPYLAILYLNSVDLEGN